VATAFPSEAAFFVSAEGTGGIEFVVGVRPNHSRAKFVHDLENLAAFIGLNAGERPLERLLHPNLYCKI